MQMLSAPPCRCKGRNNQSTASSSSSDARPAPTRHQRPLHGQQRTARCPWQQLQHRRLQDKVICLASQPSSAPASSPSSSPAPAPTLEGAPRVLVIGGTGRVGSSAAAALLSTFPNVRITLAGRNQATYEAATTRRPELKGTQFARVDIDDTASIQAALANADLVIHAAGPFQRSTNHAVLEQAIRSRVPYLDVCDDLEYSERSKTQYSVAAREAGVPALICAGIYPGTSNVMAAHIISISRKEYDDEWQYRDEAGPGGIEPDWLRYSYYTAGSGGAGPSILETSLLLAGEEVTVYKDNAEFKLPAISNRREVDFGTGVGRKGLYVYNLPEVQSARKYLRVRGASARFGTDPFVWNWVMWLIARLVPAPLLRDRGFARGLARLAEPFVRLTDVLTGETVAMKVEVDFDKDKNAAGIFVHRKMSDSVGYSVAAFAHALLRGRTSPGVWYPEERPALADRREFLRFASTGCERFDLNKPAWSMESDIQSFVGMIYW